MRVMTVFGASILLGWSFHFTTCVVVVVVNVVRAVEVVDVIEVGPELLTDEDDGGGGGGDATDPPLLDWNEAFLLTFGDGLSDPASLELVVCPEELLDSTLQDDISNDLGLEVFIRTRLSNVDTLKSNVICITSFCIGK